MALTHQMIGWRSCRHGLMAARLEETPSRRLPARWKRDILAAGYIQRQWAIRSTSFLAWKSELTAEHRGGSVSAYSMDWNVLYEGEEDDFFIESFFGSSSSHRPVTCQFCWDDLQTTTSSSAFCQCGDWMDFYGPLLALSILSVISFAYIPNSKARKGRGLASDPGFYFHKGDNRADRNRKE